jgi:hypothetical protein
MIVQDELAGLYNRTIDGFLACARDEPEGLSGGAHDLDLPVLGLSGRPGPR